MYELNFGWNSQKAELNWRKHKVRFETASMIFNDPHLLTVEERVVDGELRWQSIGRVNEQTLLTVAHLIYDEDSNEIIRIISARKADRKERQRYEEDPR